jgi:hypothetical protein
VLNTASMHRGQATVFCHVRGGRNPADESQRLVQMYHELTHVKRVYLFIDDGYQAILNGQWPFNGLTQERRLREKLEGTIQLQEAAKFQIIGTQELIPLMERLERATREIAELEAHHNPAFLLLGGAGKGTYDSPKLIEYLIRIWRPNEPLFRFDQDVVVCDASLEKLLDYYQPQVRQIFSGGYKSRDNTPEDHLLNAYAVRVAQFCDPNSGELKDTALAEKFLTQLKDVGANPNSQVISGAGFYISPELARLYPPFANADELIVWIDDHIKQQLHKRRSPSVQAGRVKKATFIQDRYPGDATQKRNRIAGQPLDFHQRTYLERLAMGCVLDELIVDIRRTILSGYQKNLLKYQKNSGARCEALLPNLPTLHRCMFPDAMKRLNQLIQQWTDEEYKGTAVHRYANTLQEDQNRQRQLVDKVIVVVSEWLELVAVWDTIVATIERLADSADTRGLEWLRR